MGCGLVYTSLPYMALSVSLIFKRRCKFQPDLGQSRLHKELHEPSESFKDDSTGSKKEIKNNVLVVDEMCCECVSPQLGVLSPQWVQALFSCALVLISRLLPLRAALRLGEDR